MSPPFILPVDLPMSPPQSLPPSPPSFTSHHPRPSLTQRAAHSFPNTPGTSPGPSFSNFGAAHGPSEAEELAFRFPVPEGHFSGSTIAVGDAGDDDDDDKEVGSVMIGKRCVFPNSTGGSGSNKGVFKKAFLADLPSTSSRPPSRSSSHGRSSSIASSSHRRSDSSKGAWQAHRPSESMLGLSGVTPSPPKSKRVSWRKGEWSVGDVAAPWSHRRALLPTVSRRWRRLLALFLLVLFTLVLAKSVRNSEETSLTDVGRRLREAQSFALKPRPAAGLNSSPSAVVAGEEAMADWTWKEGEELAALIGFMTSEDTHSIPSMTVGQKIDPELVLDFDPLHSVQIEADMREMVDHVWHERPLVVLGKGHGDPKTRDLKNALLKLRTRPAPSVLEVDVRADADQVVPVLERLTTTAFDDFPVLLIGGAKIDPALWTEADLMDLASMAGASFIKPKVKRPVPANPNKKK